MFTIAANISINMTVVPGLLHKLPIMHHCPYHQYMFLKMSFTACIVKFFIQSLKLLDPFCFLLKFINCSNFIIISGVPTKS